LENALGIVALFFAVLAAFGVIEFGINAAFFLRTASQLASEGEIVEIGRVFANWYSNVIIHLTIDAVFSAITTAVLGLVLQRR